MTSREREEAIEGGCVLICFALIAVGVASVTNPFVGAAAIAVLILWRLGS